MSSLRNLRLMIVFILKYCTALPLTSSARNLALCLTGLTRVLCSRPLVKSKSETHSVPSAPQVMHALRTNDSALDHLAPGLALYFDPHWRALHLRQQIVQGRILFERNGEIIELLVYGFG